MNRRLHEKTHFYLRSGINSFAELLNEARELNIIPISDLKLLGLKYYEALKPGTCQKMIEKEEKEQYISERNP